MKEQEDAKLSQVLHEWRVDGSLPPRFQERVWQRIEATQGNSSRVSFLPDWLTVLLARPAYAVLCAVVLVGVSASVGMWKADRVASHWDNQLAQRYVASVDPYVNQP